MDSLIKKFINKCLKKFGNEMLKKHKIPLKTINSIWKEVNPTYNPKIEDIKAFDISPKKHNDKNNKIRENIINAIINNQIPINYYETQRWLDIKRYIFDYIQKLVTKPYIKLVCIKKGGRSYHYDFDFIFYYEDNTHQIIKVELKFNTFPQFVSPIKPSQYMSRSYEEYYYTNYLPQLSLKYNLPLPLNEEYLKSIHSTNPECMKKYKELYDNSPEHCDLAKQISKESIKNFIIETELDLEKMSNYLKHTQKDKMYMYYLDNSFILTYFTMDDCVIERVIDKTHNTFKCISKSGKTIKILLRWKNGNGIAFPAFQIS